MGLNKDQAVQIRRLSSGKSFIGKRKKFIFNAVLGRSMPAGCNCGPNSSLARTLGCHCVRRGNEVIASQLPLPML